MQFRPLALRSFVSLTAGGIVGLTLTLAGSGVEALIWQALVLRATAAIVLWWRVPVSFRFALSPRHAAELGRFAYKLMISRVMNWASGQVSRFILGLYLGPADLGMFSMATRLNGVVVQVALEPKVSVARIYLRRFLAAREGLEHAAHRLFQQVSIFSFPFFIGGAAVIPTLFHAWLGPQWSGGILPTQLMFLMGVPLVTFYCATALLLALNHQAAEAWVSTLQTASVIILVLAVAPFGIAAAAAALCLRQWALLPLPLVLIRRYCGVSVGTVLLAQLPALTAASLSGAVVHLLDSRLSESFGSLTSLLILIAVGAALYALLIGLMLPRLFVDVVGHLTRRLSRAP
jgi:O-antigen/teichoic acid export membrane protein